MLDVVTWSTAQVRWRCEGKICLHLELRVRDGKQQASWRWRQYVPPKHHSTSSGLHGVIFQKTELFIECSQRSILMLSSLLGLLSCSLGRWSEHRQLAKHNILWHIRSKQELWNQRNSRCYRTALKHLFLGNGRETNNGTTSVARQQIINKQE
jgi:hypothetical protein